MDTKGQIGVRYAPRPDVKAVLTHKPASIYDDLPEERYHFPRTYLRQVEAAVADFIVYYEPGRSQVGDHARTGRHAYVATARIVGIVEDSARQDHYYALIEPGSYVLFGRSVPFHEGAHYHEAVLRRGDGETSKGAFGRAVRMLRDAEYEAILQAGFAQELTAARPPIRADDPARPQAPGLMETPESFERPIIERLLSRSRAGRCLRPRRAVGLRKHLRHDRPQDHQRRGPGRGPSGEHPSRARLVTRLDPQRRGALRDRSLDVRSRPRLDRPAT